MNPYQFEATCDICGGPGMGTVRTAAAAWVVGQQVYHKDPRTCRNYLEKKRRELERREKALKAKEQENEHGEVVACERSEGNPRR